jgi:hypothetical protein
MKEAMQTHKPNSPSFGTHQLALQYQIWTNETEVTTNQSTYHLEACGTNLPIIDTVFETRRGAV